MSVFSVLAGRRVLCGFFAARTSPVVASASSQVRALTCGSLAAPALRSATAPRLPSWLPPSTSEAGDSVGFGCVEFSDGDDGSDDVGEDVGEAEGEADGLAVSSPMSTRGAGTGVGSAAIADGVTAGSTPIATPTTAAIPRRERGVITAPWYVRVWPAPHTHSRLHRGGCHSPCGREGLLREPSRR